MKILCPACATALNVGDELAGRRVKCPGCQHVFQISPSSAVAVGLAAQPLAAPSVDRPVPARQSPLDGVQTTESPARPRLVSCPECGETLEAGVSKCPECGLSSDRTGDEVSRRAPPSDGEGRCYIFIRKDEVDLIWAIEKRMKRFIETERLDMRIMGEYDSPPDELGPDDLVISGKVRRCDYGSRMMRYWLTIVAMFGPGSCRLEVDAEVETAEEGPRRLSPRARQFAGIFGGSDAGLMKRNIQIVSNQIATAAARHATGNRFLNAHAYRCASWSLGLGLASLLPFIGILFGLIALVLGLK